MPDATTAAALSRVLLVSERDDHTERPEQVRIRRYRLARLHLDGRTSAVDRHAHLRVAHD